VRVSVILIFKRFLDALAHMSVFTLRVFFFLGAGVSEPTFMESMMGTAAAKAVGAGPPTAKVLYL
jgi:hypothetical protein